MQLKGEASSVRNEAFTPLSLKTTVAGSGVSMAATSAKRSLRTEITPSRRVGDALEGGLDVGRGQRRAIVEFHALVQLEGVGEAVGRDGPALGEIADDLRVLGGVELDEQRVERGDRMQQAEGLRAVAIVVRGLGGDGEVEDAAALGRLRRRRLRGSAKTAPIVARSDGSLRSIWISSLGISCFCGRQYSTFFARRPDGMCAQGFQG